MRRQEEQVDFGYIDIPVDYFKFSNEEKKVLCNKIIDVLLLHIDRDLAPEINRISFLDEVFESSLITNEDAEQYVVCAVLNDCRKILNED
jgi:hypothetical protein